MCLFPNPINWERVIIEATNERGGLARMAIACKVSHGALGFYRDCTRAPSYEVGERLLHYWAARQGKHPSDAPRVG